MKKNWLLFAVIFATACTTKDRGCGGTNNSETAEKHLRAKYGINATCIAESGDDDSYACADEETKQAFRCADSASSES